MHRRERHYEPRGGRDYPREERLREENFAGPGGYSPTMLHSDYGFQGSEGAYGDYGGADRFTGDYRGDAAPWMPRQERAGFNGPYAGRGPAGYRRSDDRIREDVCEIMSRHGDLDASDIEVRVQDGTVELYGNVDDRRDKYLAEDLAECIPGVTDVMSRLRVRKSSRSESYEQKFREERAERDEERDRNIGRA